MSLATEQGSCSLPDLSATAQLAADLAAAWQAQGSPAMLVALKGNLGAGKTELVRLFLRALGFEGAVPSPTYAIVLPYELPLRNVLHLDLYRLQDAQELEELGIDQQWRYSLIFIEWPEKGAGRVPAPDLTLTLAAPGSPEASADERTLHHVAGSKTGAALIARLRELRSGAGRGT